ncbi:hypothetical protein THF1C08_280020 [Vibrio jasicida]|uniref:Uncharacterized protein n=1 Tax=Vibrio jasicida TaxID=766224 RepID=A0AAU9QQH6_9VIBR|nr:hypothetical protein THF1C08_280020 [Vibrio jasicida]CAH1593523.1 hypothetical protein THF1A12_270020 [Vibrio jasicida]
MGEDSNRASTHVRGNQREGKPRRLSLIGDKKHSMKGEPIGSPFSFVFLSGSNLHVGFVSLEL